MKSPKTYPAWIEDLISLVAWVNMGVMTAFVFFAGCLTHGFWIWSNPRKSQSGFHNLSHLWGKCSLGLIPGWRFEVRGTENLVPGQHYILVANHQSVLDIALALAAIPIQFRFIAKKELFKIPFLGWHIALSGYIPVDRDKTESRKEAAFRALAEIRAGISVLMFAEGTRSPDGEIQRFKPGAFRLAQNEGVPLVPIVMDGTGAAIPKNKRRINRNIVFHCRIGVPVRIENRSALPEVMESMRESMIKTLKDIRAETKLREGSNA